MSRKTLLIVLLFFATSLNAQNVDISLLKQHVYTLASDSLMGRGFGTKGGEMAADYVEKQFLNAGISAWEGSYRHDFITSGMVKTEGCNIIGWVEGNDPILKTEFIVVGAHYDHLAYRFKNGEMIVYNGADDNASGIATLIELGRWLAENKTKLKRSVILIAFDGEEVGLVGSTYIVNNKLIPIDRVKVMFSMDMVGMLSTYEGIDLVGNKSLNNGDKILNGIAQKHGIAVKKQRKKVEQQTDTAPFGRLGIPAIHVFTSTVSPYHKPEDDAHLLDYSGIVTIAEFMIDAVSTLSNQQELKPDRRFLALLQNKWYAPTFGVRVGAGGSKHSYDNEFYIGKQIFAAQAGIFVKINITRAFSLQPELLYRTVGSHHTNGVLRTHEVTVPVNLRLSLNPRSKGGMTPEFFMLAGPYYSHKFSAKVGGNKLDFNNDFWVDEKGLQYGIGFEMMGVQLTSLFQSSFTSIDRNSKVLPSNYMFSIGFVF